jgi:hypothetical protein
MEFENNTASVMNASTDAMTVLARVEIVDIAVALFNAILPVLTERDEALVGALTEAIQEAVNRENAKTTALFEQVRGALGDKYAEPAEQLEFDFDSVDGK